jgi:hypothetical protein
MQSTPTATRGVLAERRYIRVIYRDCTQQRCAGANRHGDTLRIILNEIEYTEPEHAIYDAKLARAANIDVIGFNFCTIMPWNGLYTTRRDDKISYKHRSTNEHMAEITAEVARKRTKASRQLSC